MTLTLSIDRDVVERARAAARRLGRSLDQMVDQYLRELDDPNGTAQQIQELRRLSLEGRGRSGGRGFDRDELHARD